MKPRLELLLAFFGLAVGLIGAYVYGLHAAPQPPAFTPATDPYAKGVYAEGIVESYQDSGANINIYPNVSGTIVDIPVQEGELVRRGTILVRFDDSVQKATAEASKAQVAYARAQLKNAQDELAKQEYSYRLEPKSVSKFTLDDAINAAKVAAANLEVNEKNYNSAEGPPCLVRYQGAGRWQSSGDSSGSWRLRGLFSGHLRYLHAELRPHHRDGAIRRLRQRTLLYRRNSYSQAQAGIADGSPYVHSRYQH